MNNRLYYIGVITLSVFFIIIYAIHVNRYIKSDDDEKGVDVVQNKKKVFSWIDEFEVNTSLEPHIEKCESSVVFYSANWAGIGSLINTQLSVMAWAHATNRSFFLIDDGWNYGRWFNYWSSNSYAKANSSMYYLYYDDNHQHECALPNHLQRLEDIKSNISDYQHISTGVNWGTLSPIFNSNSRMYDNSNKSGIYRHEKIFKLRSEIARSFWKLQPQLLTHANKRSSYLQLDNYIAIHIRRGDKIIELPDGKYTSLDVFYREIDIIFKSSNNSLTANNTKILVLSDDYSIMKNLTSSKKQWKFVSTYPENSPFNTNVSFTQAMFNGWPETVRQAHGMAFVTQMELMRRANYVICTHSSNVCRLAAILRGWHDVVVNKRLVSVDVDWYPL